MVGERDKTNTVASAGFYKEEFGVYLAKKVNVARVYGAGIMAIQTQTVPRSRKKIQTRARFLENAGLGSELVEACTLTLGKNKFEAGVCVLI